MQITCVRQILDDPNSGGGFISAYITLLTVKCFTFRLNYKGVDAFSESG